MEWSGLGSRDIGGGPEAESWEMTNQSEGGSLPAIRCILWLDLFECDGVMLEVIADDAVAVE